MNGHYTGQVGDGRQCQRKEENTHLSCLPCCEGKVPVCYLVIDRVKITPLHPV